MNNIELLRQRLNSGEHVVIKLLGDSITQGVGGTGFCQDGEHIVDDFYRNDNGYCWANLLRDHVKEHYNATVVNNGCAGTTIQDTIKNLDVLVSPDDEFIICTIGTNNRHQFAKAGPRRTESEYKDFFYNCLLKLNEELCNRGKKVIFVANIPVTPGCEESNDFLWYIIHMDDINDLHKRAQEVTGYTFISLYDLFCDHIAKNNIALRSLLVDGVHPNDNGFKIMFDLLIDAFGI